MRGLFLLPLLLTSCHAGLPSTPDGWTLVWSDDFEGTGGVNSSNWIYDTGRQYPGGPWAWGTLEATDYTTSNVNVFKDGNGNLAIRAIRDQDGTWTSGRLETVKSDFKPPSNGSLAVEGRIMLPNVPEPTGYWPAFWLLGAPYRGNYNNHPFVGEVDIMENINGKNETNAVVHCDLDQGGDCNEPYGLRGTQAADGLHTDYHTYRFEFDRSSTPGTLTWFLDGKEYYQLNQTKFSSATWSTLSSNGFYMILNLAIGGNWAGNATMLTTSGGIMSIDYVAVYRKGAADPEPTSATGSPTPSRKPSSNIPTQDSSAVQQLTVGVMSATLMTSCLVFIFSII